MGEHEVGRCSLDAMRWENQIPPHSKWVWEEQLSIWQWENRT